MGENNSVLHEELLNKAIVCEVEITVEDIKSMLSVVGVEPSMENVEVVMTGNLLEELCKSTFIGLRDRIEAQKDNKLFSV